MLVDGGDIMKRYIKGSLTSGYVGIWWILNDEVVADVVSLDDGYNNGSYIHYDEFKNHLTEWRRLMIGFDAEYQIPKGYKSLERGRVVYNLRTMCYEIVCSEIVSKNIELIREIAEAFELTNCRYDIVVDTHYHIAEITGNPALDEFEYGS